ncbi:MAG: hypothetical protein ACRDP6_09465 [Actinoallomurus sp.]
MNAIIERWVLTLSLPKTRPAWSAGSRVLIAAAGAAWLGRLTDQAA